MFVQSRNAVWFVVGLVSSACGSDKAPTADEDTATSTATTTTSSNPSPTATTGALTTETAQSSAQPNTTTDQGEPGESDDAGASTTSEEPADTSDASTSMDVTSSDTTGDAGSETSSSEPTVVTGSHGEGFQVTVTLASELEPQAPTTVGIVEWSVDVSDIVEAYIDFGLTEEYGMRAPVELAEAEFRTLLLGMKPEQTYHFRIVVSDGSQLYASNDYTVETGDAPADVAIGSFDVKDAAAREPGFIVSSYWQGNASAIVYVLDQDGEIVWWYDTGIMGGVARARLSADGKNVWVTTASNNGNPIQRVSIDGLNGQTYAVAVGSHDLTPVVGAQMAFIEYGEADCDSIFLIEPDSDAPTELWDSEEVFGGAGCHGNALRYSAKEDVFTFSDVSTDVVVVDRASKTVLWGLADKVQGGVAAWGGRNHGHHLLDESIVIFANGGGEGGASAAIEYSLDGEELWRYDSGNVSANLGDVQRLPGGNTLVTFSNDSVVHEVTKENEVVLEWTGSANTRIGYAEWRTSLYGAPSDVGL
jgi:hypothetical protein